MLLAVTPDGEVLAGWQMNAYSPRGLVVQVAETTAYPEARAIAEDVAGLRALDPARWTVVSLDEVGLAADELAAAARAAVRRSDAVSPDDVLAGMADEAEQARHWAALGGWQGAAGPMLPGADAARAEGARAAALDLNGRIRRGDGEWLDGPDVVDEVGVWLGEHGIEERGPAEIEAGGPRPGLIQPPRAARLADFRFTHTDPEHSGDLDLVHARCRITIGTLECQDDLGTLAEAAIDHMGLCPGAPEDSPWTGFDGAFTQLLTGPAWGPGIDDKDTIVRLMGEAGDIAPAVHEDMVLVEHRAGRWRVTWRDRPDGDDDVLEADWPVTPGACTGCGCTDLYGCPEGCSWAAPGLCSSCLVNLARDLAENSGLDGADGALAAGRPSPPGHDTATAPFYDQAKWTARWALDVQARLTSLPGVIFHGVPDGPAACRVRVELPGYLFLGELANPGRGYIRSVTGFAAGSAAAGAYALAHALLTAALGLDAACPVCQGSGWMKWDHGRKPWHPGEGTINTSACTGCGGFGIGVPPAACDAFTEQVILLLPPAAEWTLNRHDVLDWLTRASGDEALAALAARQSALAASDTDWAAWLAGEIPDGRQ